MTAPYDPGEGRHGTRTPGEDYPRQESPRHEDPRGDQRSYLGGGQAGFGAAVSQGLANLLTFRGRASRSAYWWFLLFTILVQAALDLVVSAASHGSNSVADGTLTLISTVLTLALTVRRLHDSNHTGWWWLIGWVPVLGWLVLLVFMLLPGTRGPNRFDVTR